MKTRWAGGLVILLALLVSVSCITLPKEEDFALITNPFQAEGAIVIVVSEGMNMGAGAIISPDGYILTCAHVGTGPFKIYLLEQVVDSEVGKVCLPHDGYSVFAWEEGDLQLIKVDEPERQLPYLKIALNRPVPGDMVYAWGHPLDLLWRMSEGLVNEYKYFSMGLQLFGHTCSTNAGNSGGPMLNAAGEIVGVDVYIAAGLATVAGYVPMLDGGYAVCVDEMRPIIFDLITLDRKLAIKRKGFADTEKWIEDWKKRNAGKSD